MKNTLRGIFSATQKGFGFVLQSGTPDIYIPAHAVNTAMHGDEVICQIVKQDKPNDIGEIINVVQRNKAHFVGTFTPAEGGGLVIPDDKRLVVPVFVPWKLMQDASDGQKVQVKIDKFNDGKPHEGRVVRILGNPLDIGMDVLSIVVDYEIPYEFPKNVLSQAESLPHSVLPSEIEGRRDLRNLLTVTIDGEDTKDIDDAVSIERLNNGLLRLYVHIADVSHYVQYGTPLWKETAKRATSVYLADRVIPMLPPNLSNGICSLNPNVDRLALTCIMDINKYGQVSDHEIVKSVIHSDHAVTYTTLADILDNEDSIHCASYPDFADVFTDMEILATALRNKRLSKGALEFEFPECKIIVDADGKVVDILRRERNSATSIIEEFMICANEVVSEKYHWLDIPFVYRVHEEPDKEKIDMLMQSLRTLGISLKKGGASAKNLQTLINRVQNLPQGAAASKLVLRSLKQARYYPKALGHFGLATEFYSHFTSPIRRFPDLLIHKIISDNIAGKIDVDYIDNLAESLPEYCRHSSENERRADDCANEVAKLKKTQFMMDKIGETFNGIISHTTSSGFFVELDNTIEGFVPIGSLTDDFYEYNEDYYRFTGRKQGRIYTLGDTVTITVKDADCALRRIDFILSDEK
ncbi:MAG: ribonuclease R [Defluviitaleaceae bacterium]|nr:ribonuclease R [Defluviitaleaceae bacterium]